MCDNFESLKVHHLYLDRRSKVSGPEIFKNKNEIIDIPLPFSHENDIVLGKGMHFLFELPDEYNLKSESKGKLLPAPNIWRITIKSDIRNEDWIVISDYILEDGTATPFIHEKKIIQIGKKLKYETLKSLKAEYNKINLTSIGWGTLSFNSFYPNCKDVFGFHDENIIEDENVHYDIQGWYYEGNSILGIENIISSKSVVSTQFSIGTIIGNQVNESIQFDISIGNSLSEAFTALCLKNDHFDVNKIIEEEQFEAALNYSDLYDQKLDIISRLRHYQHEKQFIRKSNFTKWVINQNERQFEDIKINKFQNELDTSQTKLEEKLNELAQIQYDYLISKNKYRLKDLMQEINILESKINYLKNKIIKRGNYLKSKFKGSSIDHITDVEFNISKSPCCLIKLDKNNNLFDSIHKIEWEAEFIPHDTDNINQLYELNEQYTDLIIKNNSDKIYHQYGERKKFYGNSLLTDTIQLFVDSIDTQDQVIEPFLQKLIGYKDQAEGEIYEFHLEDFNQIVNGYKHTIAPFVNIFSDEELNSSARIIEKYRDQFYVYIKNEFAMSNILRNGAFRINRLCLIDRFGIQNEIKPEHIYTPPKQSIEYLPKWIEMSPRILNPLGLRVDFRKYESEFEDETPVLGWIIPVYINQHIEFFDADGYHIGFIDEKSNWCHSPFDLDNSKELKNINKDLLEIVNWFKSSCNKNNDFKENFIKEIQYTFEHIKPESYQDPSLMETIATTPIAITRTTIDLLKIGQLNTAFEEQEIPILLGDLNQYNDGLIGYWHIDDENIESTFFINNEHFGEIDTAIISYIQTIYKGISESSEDALDILKTEVKNKENDQFINLLINDDTNIDVFKKYIDNLNSIQDIRINDVKSFVKYELIENIARFEKEFRIDKKDLKNLFEELKDKYLGNETGDVFNKHILYKQYFKKAEYFIQQLKEIGVLKSSILSNDQPLKFKFQDDKSKLILSNNSGNSNSLELFTLLAPKSKLFVKTGFIPEQSISIPYNSIKEALNRIELTLLTSPIITPKEQLEISLLTDERYKWSWVNLEKNNGRHIKRITQDLALNLALLNEDAINGLKMYLKEDTFFPDQPEIRYFNMEKWEELSLNEAALKILSENKEAFLKIDPFNTRNAFIPQLVLKEGWLSIKSTNN